MRQTVFSCSKLFFVSTPIHPETTLEMRTFPHTTKHVSTWSVSDLQSAGHRFESDSRLPLAEGFTFAAPPSSQQPSFIGTPIYDFRRVEASDDRPQNPRYLDHPAGSLPIVGLDAVHPQLRTHLGEVFVIPCLDRAEHMDR